MSPKLPGAVLADAVLSQGTVPLPAAKAIKSIKARNDQVVAQFRRDVAQRRQIAREQAAMMAPIIRLIRQDERAVAAIEKNQRRIAAQRRPKITFPKVHQRIEPHVRAGSILTVAGPPYTWEWGEHSDADQTTWGTTVAYKRAPDARFNATFNAGNGGSAWASAGVGRYFVPVGTGNSTWMRIGLYAPCEYHWQASSTLEVAHTRGFIAIYVTSWSPNGSDERVEVDRIMDPWLWSHGTSWYQNHSDGGSAHYPSDTYFLASAARRYAIWAWCHTSGDASTGYIAHSYAHGSISVALPFMVFEQWT